MDNDLLTILLCRNMIVSDVFSLQMVNLQKGATSRK